jgi:arabinogalactan oligomer / maltooligosaccharide transport system permease protein
MGKKTKMKLKGICAHVVLIIACLLALFPIYWVFKSSIEPSNTMFSSTLQMFPSNPTIKNYLSIFTQEGFLTWLRNSLIISVTTTILSIAFALTAAYACSRFRFNGRKQFLSVLLMLNAFPGSLSLVALYKLFNKLGLIDNVLGLIIIYISWQLVFAIWNIKGYFDTIPKEIEEAAVIDGASLFTVFIKIILPLSKPVIAVTTIFAFMVSWNDYLVGLTFLTNPKHFTLPVGLYNLSSLANKDATNWGMFSAGSLVIAVPVALIFLILQKNLTSGLTSGGVKG